MTELPAFPLSVAHLPGDRVALRVFEERYLSMVAYLEDRSTRGNAPWFATMLIERGSEVGGGDVRCPWGVTVQVDHVEHGDSWCHVTGRAEHALVVDEWVADNPFPVAAVRLQSEEPLEKSAGYDVASALSLLAGSVHGLLRSLGVDDEEPAVGPLTTISGGRWWADSVDDGDLWRAYWTVARALPCGPLDRYSLLGPGSLPERIRRTRDVAEHVADIIAFRGAN